MTTLINPGQMKRLQTLYGQLCAHTQQPRDRASRLQWARELVRRPVASFTDLTRPEAKQLIDAVQRQLNVGYPSRRRRSQDEAARHAKDGRRDGEEFRAVPQMVSAEDLATLQSMYERLGWTRDRFDAWLRSPSSPIKSAEPAIRTKAESNRVRWALKGMLRARDLWKEKKPV